jgi:hypothetical protein
MLRKLLGTVFVLAVSGLVLADEYVASITKVDGDKVTVQKFKKSAEKGKKGEKDGDAIVLTASKDCKVCKGKINAEAKKIEAGDAVEGGLKNEMFSKASAEKGLFARITADGSTCSEIVLFPTNIGKKKKDN